MENIDFLITTFMRPECVKRLVLSIAKFYPSARIYIADQNKIHSIDFYKKLYHEAATAGLRKRPVVEFIKYDSGLSRGRNYLVSRSPSKYKLILDDDFIFTHETNIEKFLTLLEMADDIGVVGGMVKTGGVPMNYEYKLIVKDDTLYYAPDGDEYQEYQGISYKQTGCILNFALYRRDVLEQVRWDDEQKICEHLEFMYRLNQAPWKILYTPEVICDHSHQNTQEYKSMRRRDMYKKLVYKKLGVNRIKYVFNGHTSILNNDNSVTTRREAPGSW